jgi:hypothetical protein
MFRKHNGLSTLNKQNLVLRLLNPAIISHFGH